MNRITVYSHSLLCHSTPLPLHPADARTTLRFAFAGFPTTIAPPTTAVTRPLVPRRIRQHTTPAPYVAGHLFLLRLVWTPSVCGVGIVVSTALHLPDCHPRVLTRSSGHAVALFRQHVDCQFIHLPPVCAGYPTAVVLCERIPSRLDSLVYCCVAVRSYRDWDSPPLPLFICLPHILRCCRTQCLFCCGHSRVFVPTLAPVPPHPPATWYLVVVCIVRIGPSAVAQLWFSFVVGTLW